MGIATVSPGNATQERRSLARDPHNRRLRSEAKKRLARPPVEFTGIQARAVGRGFANYVAKSACTVLSCAIMPCHVHMVVARHRYSIEQVANLLKGAATTELMREGLHPFAKNVYRNGVTPTPWTRKPWSCFLDCNDDIARAVRYVENNPIKEGNPKQTWSFVTKWDP